MYWKRAVKSDSDILYCPGCVFFCATEPVYLNNQIERTSQHNICNDSLSFASLRIEKISWKGLIFPDSRSEKRYQS